MSSSPTIEVDEENLDDTADTVVYESESESEDNITQQPPPSPSQSTIFNSSFGTFNSFMAGYRRGTYQSRSTNQITNSISRYYAIYNGKHKFFRHMDKLILGSDGHIWFENLSSGVGLCPTTIRNA